MTRIGKVTVKPDAARDYLPNVLQHVTENGEPAIAKFEFSGWRYRRVNGAIVDFSPHAEYRRVGTARTYGKVDRMVWERALTAPPLMALDGPMNFKPGAINRIVVAR